jgi:peptidyl-tRNA hydrolase
MSNTRLTVVVRRDLQMPAGLLAAQVAHIADGFERDKLADIDPANTTVEGFIGGAGLEWKKEPYLSVLAVETRDDLVTVRNNAEAADLPFNVWHDTIPSPTFEGDVIPQCFVGLSIGPADFDAIKAVTVRLKLY